MLQATYYSMLKEKMSYAKLAGSKAYAGHWKGREKREKEGKRKKIKGQKEKKKQPDEIEIRKGGNNNNNNNNKEQNMFNAVQ